jgi:prepilin peptidase CpaA
MAIQTATELALSLACLLLALATILDICFRTIPNPLCAVLAVLALGVRVAAGDCAGALLAGFLVFAVAVFCWTRGWLGGGDVKLLTAAVLLVPPGQVMGLLLDVSVAGGALAACYLLLSLVVAVPRGRPPGQILLRIARAERWRISRRRSLPYACAIAAGAFITLLNG